MQNYDFVHFGDYVWTIIVKPRLSSKQPYFLVWREAADSEKRRGIQNEKEHFLNVQPFRARNAGLLDARLSVPNYKLALQLIFGYTSGKFNFKKIFVYGKQDYETASSVVIRVFIFLQRPPRSKP